MNQVAADRKRILVVEDDADFAALVSSVLLTVGYDVETAVDGEEAMEAVRRLPPDLITLDIQMPGETGVMFYRRMKSQAPYRDIPVIVISGLFDHDAENRNIIRPFFETQKLPPPEAYVEKPLDVPGLVELVAEHLQPVSPS